MKFKKFFIKYKWDILCNITFVLVYFLIIFIKSKGFHFILGSTTDFQTQHFVIPEYFRNLFYNTGDLFPNFAFNLGSGQNIYYLSYYGLFSPIILLSYLFPMIEMIDYLIIMMGIVVLSTVSLFYFYLRKNNYSYLVSFLCSFIFLCSAPLIYHSNRHIMFIDYLPFLVLGFYGIDKYIKKKSSFLLIISVVLIIFTSYYFSISAICVLFLFGIFRYLLNSPNIKEIFLFSCKLIIRFLISILISSILILPTFYTLISGRSGTASTYEISSLFEFNNYLLHDSYSMGLTYICLFGLIIMFFYRKKGFRFLSFILILVSSFPIFSYILNVFLYVSNKVLIPFIPLILIVMAEFFKLFIKNKWFKCSLIIYVIVSSFLVCISANLDESLITNLDDNLYDKSITFIESLNDDDFYRVNSSFMDDKYTNKISSNNEYKSTIYSSSINKNYRDLYNHLFNNSYPYRSDYIMNTSNNILFQIYMGEKYLITDYEYDYIYEKVKTISNLNIYKNDYILPLGYATDKVINKVEFKKLRYPDNFINMLGRVVVDENTNSSIKKSSELVDLEVIDSENIFYDKTNNGYFIDSLDNGKLTLKLNKNSKNKLIVINFDILKNVSCKNNDLGISINGIFNILTCKSWKYPNYNYNFNYVIIGNKDNLLDIEFNKGKYNIGNINVNLIDFDLIKNINKNIDPFIINKSKTKGDIITGDIDVSNDGYFSLAIPYDKGFKIYVDGREVDYFKINNYFIGFKIKKGEHNIEIIYKAPLKNISIILSLIGIISFIIIIYIERKKT